MDYNESGETSVEGFLSGKSELTISLFEHFTDQFSRVGNISLHATKTMIAVSNGDKRIAWITQLGKNFIHVVLPFEKPYPENLCFQKIAQVPGDDKQFNHHLRIYSKDDINEEVMGFMKLAFDGNG
ncbi:MAG: hypothetical protein K0S09_729 [Sphingobacteriaceae bacterium]|jgi:hypothetical protein|nr:hypothetical protein [Sphingobacteriaceae bacterium]